jgi:hypothetical protein
VPDYDNSLLKTRRAMLAGLAATAGSAAVGAPVISAALKPQPAPPPAPSVIRVVAPLGWQKIFLSPKDSTADDWRQLGPALFTLVGENGPCAVRISEVRPLPAAGKRPAGLRAQAFAVLFEANGAGRAPPGNRVYRFTHAQYGGVDLFVGPVSLSSGKSVLVAVLN